jgi:hypothetical protein
MIVGVFLVLIVVLAWGLLTPFKPPVTPPMEGRPDVTVTLHESFLNRTMAEAMQNGQFASLQDIVLDIQPQQILRVTAGLKTEVLGLAVTGHVDAQTQLQVVGGRPHLEILRVQVGMLSLMSDELPDFLRKVLDDLERVVDKEMESQFGSGLVLVGITTTDDSVSLACRAP